MAAGITWYDVLGVTAGASSDTLHRAYAERISQLTPELFSGAQVSYQSVVTVRVWHPPRSR